MNAEDALRYLGSESAKCRDKQSHEALCLLLPALLKINGLKPMDIFEANSYSEALKHKLAHDFRFDREPTRVGCGGNT
jgi:hypothetical protein